MLSRLLIALSIAGVSVTVCAALARDDVVAGALISASARGASSVAPLCTPQWRAVLHSDALSGVSDLAVLSATDVWMVGSLGPRKKQTPLIFHWDGRRIRRFASFTPTSAKGGGLVNISADRPDDVWAVGIDGDIFGIPIVMRWNGRIWKAMPAPPITDDAVLVDVAAIAPNDVWVVGEVRRLHGTGPILARWNGRSWRLYDNFIPRIYWQSYYYSAIAATSSSDVWALGTSEAADFVGYSSIVAHWNGHTWRKLTPPDALGGGTTGTAIAALAPKDAWTYDEYTDASVESENRVRLTHWHNEHPVGGYNRQMPGITVSAIAGTSEANVWLVGGRTTSNYRSLGPLVMHWNHGTLRIQHTLLDHFKDAWLGGLATLSPADVWAAGNHLLARYSC